jgi:hypothetical protein
MGDIYEREVDLELGDTLSVVVNEDNSGVRTMLIMVWDELGKHHGMAYAKAEHVDALISTLTEAKAAMEGDRG